MTDQPTNQTSPPLVFISYSLTDKELVDQLNQQLAPFQATSQINLWHDNLTTFGEDWSQGIISSLQMAKVIVLIISSEYIRNEAILTEIHQQLERIENESLQVLPVLASQCEWQKVSWLKKLKMFPYDSTAISDLLPPDREGQLKSLAGEIVRLAKKPSESNTGAQTAQTKSSPSTDTQTINDDFLKSFKLSPGTSSVLDRARTLASLASEGPQLVSSTVLLLAVAECSNGKIAASDFLQREFTKNGDEKYRKLLNREYSKLSTKSPEMMATLDKTNQSTSRFTQLFEELFRLAEDISKKTAANPSGDATIPDPDITEKEYPTSRHRPGHIFVHHLLAALLTFREGSQVPGAQKRLSELGTDDASLRQGFFNFVTDYLKLENHPHSIPTWGTILGIPEEEANRENLSPKTGAAADPAIDQSQPKPDVKAATEIDPNDLKSKVAGFFSDTWEGEDLLGIKDDVNALAALIAAWSIEPPLSIGLFGDWGSGKTHFMRQMKKRVEVLSKKARESKEPQADIGYYKNIVQIEFNAWHYINGNLWASLVEHIFARLKLFESEDVTYSDARRKSLMEKMEIGKEKKAKLTARAGELEQERTNLQNQTKDIEGRKTDLATQNNNIEVEKGKLDSRVSEIEGEKTELQRQAGEAEQNRQAKRRLLEQLRDDLKSVVLDQLNLPIQFNTEQQKLLTQMGLSTQDVNSIAKLRDQYGQIDKTAGRVRAQLNMIKKDPLRFILIAAVAAVLPVALYLSQTILARALGQAVASIAPIITIVISIVAVISPYWKKVTRGLDILEKKDEEIRQAAMAKLKTETDNLTKKQNELKQQQFQLSQQQDALRQQSADLTKEQSALTQQQNTLAQQRLETQKEAKAIESQIESLNKEISQSQSAKLLSEFIEDRAAATDYRRHLGILALIRRDFEKMAALFREQRKDEEAKKEGQDLKVVNRIILYIDDLDRCPPQLVVDVLQAIHLLLAFPLFVVVVGVDARWVTRSLEEKYEWLQPEEENRDGKKSKHTGRTATAHDYLEKIFQIPFWLDPLDDTSCKGLITGLTEASRRQSENRQNGRKPENNAEDQSSKTKTPEVNLNPVYTEEEIEAITNFERFPPNPDIVTAAAPTEDQQGSESNAKHVDTPPAEVIDLSPASLDLTVDEVNYMKELSRLIGRSPRAVKRFLNCYRLYKVWVKPESLRQFLGVNGDLPQYKLVMMMLGIITGQPSISPYLIYELQQLINKSQEPKVTSLASVIKTLNDLPDVTSLSEWSVVSSVLDELLKKNEDLATADISEEMANRVSRYSFRQTESQTIKKAKSQAQGKM